MPDHSIMRLRFALLTLLASVSLVAAGCGGSSGPERTLMSLASSAEKTSSAGTYRTELRTTMTIPGLADGLEITATGAVDTVARRYQMSMDMSKMLGALVSATGAAAPKASDLRMDMVMDGLTMYMRMPLLAGELPSGKTWVSMDVAKLAAAGGADLSALLGRSYADPAQYLDYLTAHGDLEELGTEDVRGVATRHVRTTVDLEAYLEALDPTLKKDIAPLVDQFEQMAGSVRPVMDAWVDGDGLVRRVGIDMSMGIPATGAGGSVEMTMTMDLFDFGADVAIEVPPASQVMDGTALGLGG